ncbi:hypothetical protein [Actinokineospora sp.]|uniref:hypothetical protein n=1 Tax=Actinokineospora sp. TaxID=1872133 RepID=UPI0040379DD0
MTGYSTTYQVACAPGPNAAAAVSLLPGGVPVLVVYFDPVNMTIQCPPTVAAQHDLAAFCHELAQEATHLADLVDPAPTHPRHLLHDGGGPADE